MSQLKTNAIRHTTATSDAITLASNGTATAKITNNLSHRNIIINGAMNVAQRGTSSTSSGFHTVDRFKGTFAQASVTQTQSDVASGTDPYNLGFRKAIKLANTSTSTNSSALATINYYPEAQDLANSGWNYTSTSSYITLSFWVKSSLAGTYYVNLFTEDTTQQNFPYSFALSADTWTKVTKTIPGNSNITINNDIGAGMEIKINAFLGTGAGASGSPPTLDVWAAKDGSHRLPVFSQDWCNTANATFEVTGVQLEVGDVATDFEHRSYGDELTRCQRYYQLGIADGVVKGTGSGSVSGRINFQQTMRTDPSIGKTSGDIKIGDMISWSTTASSPTITNNNYKTWGVSQGFSLSGMSGFSSGGIYRHENNSSQAVFYLDAEL